MRAYTARHVFTEPPYRGNRLLAKYSRAVLVVEPTMRLPVLQNTWAGRFHDNRRVYRSIFKNESTFSAIKHIIVNSKDILIFLILRGLAQFLL